MKELRNYMILTLYMMLLKRDLEVNEVSLSTAHPRTHTQFAIIYSINFPRCIQVSSRHTVHIHIPFICNTLGKNGENLDFVNYMNVFYIPTKLLITILSLTILRGWK